METLDVNIGVRDGLDGQTFFEFEDPLGSIFEPKRDAFEVHH